MCPSSLLSPSLGIPVPSFPFPSGFLFFNPPRPSYQFQRRRARQQRQPPPTTRPVQSRGSWRGGEGQRDILRRTCLSLHPTRVWCLLCCPESKMNEGAPVVVSDALPVPNSMYPLAGSKSKPARRESGCCRCRRPSSVCVRVSFLGLTLRQNGRNRRFLLECATGPHNKSLVPAAAIIIGNPGQLAVFLSLFF